MIRKILFFIWFALIVFLSVSPNSLGDQSLLHKIALTPSGFFQHVLGYFILGIITFYTFDKKRIWFYLLGFLVLGALLELIQYKIPSRSFNLYDLLGNSIGLLGIALIIIFKKRKFRHNEH